VLSKSHNCLGAIGCALVCNECLHWYHQCHVSPSHFGHQNSCSKNLIRDSELIIFFFC
jgi:hypothetical protein